MKITTITIALACLISFSVAGQIKIKTGKAEILLSKEAKKVSQINAVNSQSVGGDGTVSVQKGEYEYDDQSLSLSYTTIKPNRSFLLETKKAMDNRIKRTKINDSYYQSNIVKIKTHDALISRKKGGDVNYYVFYIVNNDYSYIVSGILEFKPGEEKKAEVNLTDILNGIKFQD